MQRETSVGQSDGRTVGLWRQIRRTVQRILGAPDYEAYLEHCRRAGHPSRLTEREYIAQFFESKGKGVRCC